MSLFLAVTFFYGVLFRLEFTLYAVSFVIAYYLYYERKTELNAHLVRRGFAACISVIEFHGKFNIEKHRRNVTYVSVFPSHKKKNKKGLI